MTNTRISLWLFALVVAVVLLPLAAANPCGYGVALSPVDEWGFGVDSCEIDAMGPNHTCTALIYARAFRLGFFRVGVYTSSEFLGRRF
jgi:hypothetical protein